MYTYLQIKSGANVKIRGLKFDGAAQGSYGYYFCFYDNSHTSLVIDNCEFDSVKNNIFYCGTDCHTDSLIINDCQFYNGLKSGIVFEASSASERQTCDKLVVKNSTFANFQKMDGKYLIDYRNYGNTEASNMRLEVDHCTFYNYGKKGSNYHAIYSGKSTNVAISNCIFANDTITGQYATYCYGGTVKNCVSYNLNNRNWDNCPAFTDCSTTNPLFVNAPAGNFALKGNWSTGEVSPARSAGTDGSDLGDPRWKTAETIPNADLTAPYFLEGKIAQLQGNIFYSAEDSLHWENKSTSGTAIWKINALSGGIVQATANYKTGSASGSQLQLVILDADGNQVGDTLKQGWHETAGDKALAGFILLPKAGVYTIKLPNAQPWSSAKLRGVTLTKADDVRTMYFKPGVWDTNNGGDAVKFAIWCFNGAVEDSWSEFMTLVDGKTDIYSTVIGASYNKVIFVRLNGSLDEPAWGTGKAYNQTSEELEPIPSGKNLMLITDWSAGSWKEYKETLGDGWYLIGKFDNVEEWTIDKLSAEKKFTLNSGHEFMITTELLVGDEFKAGYVYYDEITDIKPAGDNYIVDTDHAGTDKTIYFNEAEAGGDDWFAHTFYIEKNSGTSLDNVLDTDKTVKAIENGQIVIIKNGVRYNVLGTVVR